MGQATVVPKGFEAGLPQLRGASQKQTLILVGPGEVSEPCSALLCNCDAWRLFQPCLLEAVAFLEEAQGAGFKGCRAGWGWQQEECRCLYSTCFSRLLLSPNCSWGLRQSFQKEP